MFSKRVIGAPATVADNAFLSVLTLCDVPCMATSDLSGFKTRELYIKLHSPLEQHRQKTIIKYNKINVMMI